MAEQPTGLVFDVQRFSVHDGPGIRTTVFFKGCPLRCPWCQNPESLRAEPEIAFVSSRCQRSGECITRCDRHALIPGAQRVLRDRCDGCGQCVQACAFGALELIGRTVTVAQLVDEVLHDRTFFETSGGGVTVSGGEPTYQLEFVVAFAAALRAHKISVGMQTCGAFRWDALAPHLALFDFIHFDLKLMDAEQHRALIGSDNRHILENARRLRGAGTPVVFRAPMVPGYTDTEDNLAAMAAFLKSCGVATLHLLGYHPMGEAKLVQVGAPIPPLALRDPLRGPALLARATERLRAHGIEVTT